MRPGEEKCSVITIRVENIVFLVSQEYSALQLSYR
jgi:hypothetical protein